MSAALLALGAGGYSIVELVTARDHARPVAVGTTPPVATTTAPALSGDTTGALLTGSTTLKIGHATQMVAVPGGVWLSSWDTGLLTRVTGPVPRVGRQVRIGGPRESARSISYGAQALWVVDSASNALLKLDAVDGRRLQTLALAGWGEGDSVAYGSHELWVACTGRLRGQGGAERLLRIDPANLRVTRVTPLPGEGADLSVAAGGADVWVGGPTRLSRIDPRTGDAHPAQVVASTPLGVSGDVAWTYVDSALTSLDASTGVVLATSAAAPTSVSSGAPFAVDPSGRAWTDIPGAAAVMIRPTGAAYHFVGYSGPVDAIAVDDRLLWIYSGTQIQAFDIGEMNID